MRNFLRNNYIKIFLALFFLSTAVFFVISFKSFRTGKLLKINEVCTSNFSVSEDNAGRYRDYIEIANAGKSNIYLAGYKIKTVKDRKSNIWEFPGINIGPGQHTMVFFSSDYQGETPETGEDQSLDIREFVMSGRFFRHEAISELHAPLDLSSEGCSIFLISPSGEVIDKALIPKLSYDNTYSRYPDITGEFSVRSATPEKSNDESGEIRQRMLKEPVFSVAGGFYDSPVKLSLSAGEGEKIYYTLDGSEPDENSIPYNGPIEIGNASENENIYSIIKDVSTLLLINSDWYSFTVPPEKVDKATVVRAAAVNEDGDLGKTGTESFFIGLDKDRYKDKAVISLVSDPEGLFGEEEGIYVLGNMGNEYRKEHPNVLFWGTANYSCHGRQWEREAELTVFDEEHDLIMSDKAGIRIRGNWSRSFPQKSLNLYSRKIYSGSDTFSVPLLKGDNKESSLSLFSGGTDLDYKILDRLAASLAEDLNITVMHYRPAHLFLNGEYWGIMYLTDKYTNDFLSDRYGTDKDNTVLIKDNKVEGGNEEDIRYYEDLRYMAYSGLKDRESFEKFSEVMDIDSMTDYYAFEIYIGAQFDWPSRNVALFRSIENGQGPYEDGKWRYMLFDVNHETMNIEHIDNDNIEMALKDDQIFSAAFENEDFRELFFEKLEGMEKVFCTLEVAESKIDMIESDARDDMMLWYDRFFGGIDKETYYDNKLQDIRNYFKKRPAAIERLVRKYNGTQK